MKTRTSHTLTINREMKIKMTTQTEQQPDVANKVDVFVMPIRDVLDGKGCVWEYILYRKGWNELHNDKKPGVIKGCFELSNHSVVFDIYWPGVDCLTKNVFHDEVKKICLHKNTVSVLN